VKILQSRLVKAFADRESGPPELLVQAPGRVNLIGEHTDYNEGFVLPCAIGFQTMIASRKRSDRKICAVALDLDSMQDQFSLDEPLVPRSTSLWTNYVRGAVEALLKRGAPIGGVDLVISGDVPKGVGLSSSASMLVAIIETFKDLYGLSDLSSTEVARVAQAAENNFVGVNVGIMDQLVSTKGVARHAIKIDCRTLETEPVKIPDNAAIMIVGSGVKRGLVDSEYNKRREQCSAAAAFFKIPALRDLDVDRLIAEKDGLDETVFRRARHIVTENQRVLEACAALEGGDLPFVGQLMASSHASMRDDFEITTPAIDQLVDMLNDSIDGEGGARMTGGGFGGCVVAVLHADRTQEVIEEVRASYRTPDGEAPPIFLCSAEAGAGVVLG
jgi:galactokinase